MNRPLTKKEWLAFLEKACDEFDWESAGQKREWVGLTDEERREAWLSREAQTPTTFAEAIEQALKEKNT
jgi:hypothetical protein